MKKRRRRDFEHDPDDKNAIHDKKKQQILNTTQIIKTQSIMKEQILNTTQMIKTQSMIKQQILNMTQIIKTQSIMKEQILNTTQIIKLTSNLESVFRSAFGMVEERGLSLSLSLSLSLRREQFEMFLVSLGAERRLIGLLYAAGRNLQGKIGQRGSQEKIDARDAGSFDCDLLDHHTQNQRL